MAVPLDAAPFSLVETDRRFRELTASIFRTVSDGVGKHFLAVWSPAVPPASTISNSVFCIDEFIMILSVNSYYFLKEP
jgi:hypothetical protein